MPPPATQDADSAALADLPGIPAPTLASISASASTSASAAAGPAAAGQPHSRDPAPAARFERPTALNSPNVRLCRYFGTASGTLHCFCWFHTFGHLI